MASRIKYRKKWLRWHKQYEREAYRELQKTFHRFSNNIEWNDLTKFNYISEVQMSVNSKLMGDSYNTIYKNVGLTHGNRVGKGINTELKEFTTTKFESDFLKNLALLFVDPKNGWKNRIITVNKTFSDEIIKLLSVRLAEGKTIEQAQIEVRKIVNKPNFNRPQALRIARTETTAAANFAATEASGVSGFVMLKEWISALDARTRDDHSAVNGKRVPEGEAFSVGGEKLLYPGDPRGSAGNVVNCRCTVATIPARDSNGDLIPK